MKGIFILLVLCSYTLGNRISIGSDIVTKVGEQVEVVCNSENYYRYGSRYNTDGSPTQIKWYVAPIADDYSTYQALWKWTNGSESIFFEQDLISENKVSVSENGDILTLTTDLHDDGLYIYCAAEDDIEVIWYGMSHISLYTHAKNPTVLRRSGVLGQQREKIGGCLSGFAYPKPKVTFYQNGIEIEDVETSELILPHVDGFQVSVLKVLFMEIDPEDHNTEITCRVTSGIEPYIKNKVRFLSSPKVYHDFSEAWIESDKEGNKFEVGDIVEFRCLFNGYPKNARVTKFGFQLGNHWQKETIRLRISEQMNNQTIICEVQDDDEETVQAEYKVELVEKLRDVQVMGGNVIPGTSGSLELTCFADARPAAIYQWTKDGKHMGEGAQVEVNEPGSYQCIASNSFGMIYSANHEVRDVVPPSVWVTTENNYVEEGDDVIMNCWFNYDGDDQDYHVRWSVVNEVDDEQQVIFDYGVRGNTSLYENNFNEKYSTNDGRDLKIHNVQKDSNETYYCILITLDGIAYNSTNIYVSESNRDGDNTQTKNKSEDNEDQQNIATTFATTQMTIENEHDRNNQENMTNEEQKDMDNEDQKDMDNERHQESMSYTKDEINEGQQNMNITEYKNTNITKEENMNSSEEHQTNDKEEQINNNSNKQDEYKLNNEDTNNKTSHEQDNKYSQYEVEMANEEKINSEYKQNFNETEDNYMNNKDYEYMEISEETKTDMSNEEPSMKENEESSKDSLSIKEQQNLNNDDHSNKYNQAKENTTQENKPKEQQSMYKEDQESMNNADFMKNQEEQKIENESESENKQEYNFTNILEQNSTNIKEEYNEDNNEDYTMIEKNYTIISEQNGNTKNSEAEGDYSNQKSLNNNVETTTSYIHKDFTTHAESNNSEESIEKEFNENMFVEYVYDEDMYDEDLYDEDMDGEESYEEDLYDEDESYEVESYDGVYTTEKMKQNEDENNSTAFNTPDVNSNTSTLNYDAVISMNETTNIHQETESELSSDVDNEIYEIATEMYLQEENDSYVNENENDVNEYVNENFQTTSADYLTNPEEFTTTATETEKVSETEVTTLSMNKTDENSSCYFEEDENDSYEMGTNDIDFEIYFMRQKKTMKDFSFYNSDDEFSIMVKSVSLNGKKPVKMAKVEVYTFNLFQDGSCYLTEDTVVSKCEPQIIEANRAKRRLKGSIKLENQFTQCNFVIRVRVITEDGNNFYQKLTWNDMKNSEQIVEKKSFYLIKPAETH